MALDRNDPATSLIAQQRFEERLLRINLCTKRPRYQSVVAIIDIIDTDQTLQVFGFKVADSLAEWLRFEQVTIQLA